MKIAVITSENIPSQWAHSINLMKHAQGFHNLKHEVAVLVIQGLFEKIYQRKIKNIHDFYDISKSISFHTFMDNPFNFFKKIKYIKSIFHRFIKIFPILERIYIPERNLSNFIKKSKFDLTYARSFQAAYYNILNKNPTILETHSTNTKQPKFQNLIKLKENPYFKGIVTIHNDLKNNYIKGGIAPEKILVIEDAVDLEKFDKINISKKILRKILKIHIDKNIVMYCGSLKPGKGINKIIETSKHFDNETMFYIIGGNQKEVEIISKRLKKENIHNVILTGFVKNKLIPFYLKSADVVFMPYDVEEKEKIMDIRTTSPLKLFEYMASKNPIVSSNIPAISKVVKHGEDALLANPKKSLEFVEFIKILLNDKNISKKIASSAYNKVKNFTYDKRCSRIVNSLLNTEV